jgi:hypothetical protein
MNGEIVTPRAPLDVIADIHSELRWLDLAHSLQPEHSDTTAYHRLTERLNTALLTLLAAATGAPLPQSALPADLANTAFPASLSDSLTKPPPPNESPPTRAPERSQNRPPTVPSA